MFVIKNSLPSVFLLLGKQTVNCSAKYRLFSAVTIVRYKNKVLIYNSATKELLSFNEKEVAFLDKSSVEALDIPQYLIERYFFVPENFNDKKLMDQVRAILRSLNNKNENFYEIFTTTNCNARCFYCFEAGIIHKDMDDTTAEAVADYIVSKNKDKRVKFEWFGGEPLYNCDAIDIITKRLIENGIEFSSKMITNGSLFDEELVTKAKKDWNLKRVQITLDGTEKVYNRCKNYIDFTNASPFIKVIDNIELLLHAEIKVVIRLNFDFYNSQNLYELVDFLRTKFGNNKNLFIYTYPLYENCGYKRKSRSYNEKIDLVNSLIAFEEYCIKIGINCVGKLNNNLNLSGCMPSDDNATVISVDGEFFKCPHVLDEKPFGSINTTEIDYDIIASWKEKADENNHCDKCFNYIDCFRMKKCPHDMPCDGAYRKLQRFKLENKIKKAYETYLEINNKHE